MCFINRSKVKEVTLIIFLLFQDHKIYIMTDQVINFPICQEGPRLSEKTMSFHKYLWDWYMFPALIYICKLGLGSS